MHLADLDARGAAPQVILLQTPSTKLQIFLEDKLKNKYGCKQEALIDISTKKDLKKVKEVLGIIPPFAKKWFVSINLDKFSDKDVIKTILDANTCVFFLTCSKYAIYKRVKEELKKKQGVYDYYITYMRRSDLLYLYDGFTTNGNKLSRPLFDFVAQSYASDVDALMELLTKLAQGEVFKNRSDIADVCGIGGLSVESFLFSLLKPLSGSAKGLNKVLSNRIKVGSELTDAMGRDFFYNSLSKAVRCFIEIKTLCISGVVYKTIRQLPESYDEKALSRYNRYLWKIKSIPLSELLILRQQLGTKPWRSDLDMISFIYSYYTIKAKELLKCRF